MVATARLKFPPPINYSSKGAIGCQDICIDQTNSVWILIATGTPVNGVVGTGTGAGFAGIGSMFIDATAGKLYINTGTKASPVWTVVGTQT